MSAQAESVPRAVAKRLHAAQNQHDLEAFVACFAEHYLSEQPAHPARRFRGRDQVRTNWSHIFDSIPDFQSELLRLNVDGDTAWTEWHWQGTQPDGTHLEMAGVIIFGLEDGRIAWGRLYVEPVEEAGADIDDAVKHMTKRSGQ